MICEHTIPRHLYAGDSQLYVSFASGDSAAALNGLQSCLASVQSWVSMNKLKLNPDKTDFPLIGNERQRSKYLSMFIEIDSYISISGDRYVSNPLPPTCQFVYVCLSPRLQQLTISISLCL